MSRVKPIQLYRRPLFVLLLLGMVWALGSANVLAAGGQDTEHHVGEITPKALLEGFPVFAKEYTDFEVDAAAQTQLPLLAQQTAEGQSLLVLFGTWCHDSQREVPRLLKLLNAAEADMSKVRLVAVNYEKEDPQGIAKAHKLRYTPTIILLKDDKELGRIVERPKQSLAQDLVALSGQFQG